MTARRVRVLSAGLATVQDRGRSGFEDVGVAPSGAFDQFSLAVLCRLLDLPPDSAVVEILDGVTNLTLETGSSEAGESEAGGGAATMTVAVLGGLAAHVGTRPAPLGTAFDCPAGSVLAVRAAAGVPAYVGIRGLDAERVLGSCSYDTKSRMGPAPLHAGVTLDLLPLAGDEGIRGRVVSPAARTGHRHGPIRYIPGPHPLTAAGASRWTVTTCARSGIRLTATGPVPVAEATLPSMPVLPGCIQVTPSGEAIILGPDAGVTGGYPIMGGVISSDLPRLAWLAPGASITLEAVGAQTAADAWADQQRRLAHSTVDITHLSRTGIHAAHPDDLDVAGEHEATARS